MRLIASAFVTAFFIAGSAQEGYGETGMAHLLEHLQLKG